MSALRKLVLWIGLHVPLGGLNPYLVGFGIKSKPIPDDEDKKKNAGGSS